MATAPEQLSTLEIEPGGCIRLFDGTGDSPIQWDPADPEQVAKAELRFNQLKHDGYMAYKVSDDGKRTKEVVHAFDPNLKRILMHSVVVGG
jgi:hypothetical protein